MVLSLITQMSAVSQLSSGPALSTHWPQGSAGASPSCQRAGFRSYHTLLFAFTITVIALKPRHCLCVISE